jgi:hypothetical protein
MCSNKKCCPRRLTPGWALLNICTNICIVLKYCPRRLAPGWALLNIYTNICIVLKYCPRRLAPGWALLNIYTNICIVLKYCPRRLAPGWALLKYMYRAKRPSKTVIDNSRPTDCINNATFYNCHTVRTELLWYLNTWKRTLKATEHDQ